MGAGLLFLTSLFPRPSEPMRVGQASGQGVEVGVGEGPAVLTASKSGQGRSVLDKRVRPPCVECAVTAPTTASSPATGIRNEWFRSVNLLPPLCTGELLS